MAELRKAGPAIRLSLDPPRYDVNVVADDAAMGDAKAAVTLVEFSDFQCPFCARVMPTLKRVRETYGDRVRIVWKDFPLTAIHPQAFRAAEAGQCAREQGKFWEYHDRLFANQQMLDVEFLKKYAADTGLDAAKFSACMDTAKYGDRVQEQMGIGARLGVESTPTTFINGRLVSGAQPYEVFAAIIDEELERAAPSKHLRLIRATGAQRHRSRFAVFSPCLCDSVAFRGDCPYGISTIFPSAPGSKIAACA